MLHPNHPIETAAEALHRLQELRVELAIAEPAGLLDDASYLHDIEEDINALVLGCTHYPLLKPLIADVLGRDVRLIDSAEETAAETKRVLEEKELLAPKRRDAAHRFVASDAAQQFLRLGQRFLGGAIDRVETLTLG